MVNPCNHRAVCQFSLTAGVVLAGVLLAAKPAAAQYVITPDRSVVNIGRQQPIQMRANFTVQPVVIPGNRFVRISGTYSGVVVDSTKGYPGTGFIKPFYASDRAKAANFSGRSGPVFVNPFQPWW